MEAVIGLIFLTIFVVMFAILVVAFAGLWKVFTKAGHPGWAAIVPIYNVYIKFKIAGKPGWWLLLLLIPGVNFAILVIVSLEVAKAFGKGAGFGVGLALLGFVFYPILGFGDAEYQAGPPLPA
jgi:hypothetical protein